MQTPIRFPVFLVLWNAHQGQETPRVHLKIANWLEKRHAQDDTRLLLMAFRSAGKSTIVGLFCAWLLYTNPNVRILVVAADQILARKMVRHVKRVIEQHPLTAHLRPDTPDQWGTDRFTIRRDRELRDPSMLARGISANVTGSRADIIICDDVEVPNTSDTVDKRADLRARLQELNYVLAAGGTMLYVGTPHAFDTIYTTRARVDLRGHTPFLRGYAALRLPLLDAQGKSIWPERFPDSEIETLRLTTGPNRFRGQMLLQPVQIAEGRIDWQALQRYADDLHYVPELQKLFLGSRQMVSGSAWWDPSFGRKGGDGSVFAAVFTDAEGHLWLHRVAYLRTKPDDDLDEATQQCRVIAQLMRTLYLPAIAVEINGIGRFLPAILRRELALAHVPTSVIEVTQRTAKAQRILEAFDAPLAAKLLHAHESVFDTPFYTELQEWVPEGRSPDDGLDAVAGAIALEPMRLKAGRITGGPMWRKGQPIHITQTDFKI